MASFGCWTASNFKLIFDNCESIFLCVFPVGNEVRSLQFGYMMAGGIKTKSLYARAQHWSLTLDFRADIIFGLYLDYGVFRYALLSQSKWSKLPLTELLEKLLLPCWEFCPSWNEVFFLKPLPSWLVGSIVVSWKSLWICLVIIILDCSSFF